MTMLNLRLSYWLRNAGYPPYFDVPAVRHVFARWGGPGATWIARELFSQMSERQQYLNISDGGHIENLGAYELLRRRCKFVICIDGEASRDCLSLVRLIRYARTDFGISIDMDWSALEYEDGGRTQQHFAIGRIHYPAIGNENEPHTGFLLFIKATVTGNEPDDVVYYQQNHEAFPTEPTTDQFFGEEQFEAYRRLGEHIAETLLDRSGLSTAGHVSDAGTERGAQRSVTVRDLFRELAGNLLKPGTGQRLDSRGERREFRKM